MRLTILPCLVIAALCVLTLLPANADDAQTVAMHGFVVDFSKVGDSKFKHMEASLQRQFDIVEEAGLPTAVLAYFQTVPVVIVPTLKKGFGRAGMVAGQQIVELKAAALPRDRPILLHELLHAYHGQRIGSSQFIRDAYRDAVQSKMYPKSYAKAHFLENPREYFAVIGSIFLYGKKIDQPPYDCKIPAQQQPEFIAFLTEHFGPHTCK